MRRHWACVLADRLGDCGPAALATVALHYGSRLSLSNLRSLLNTDLQGTDLLSLRDGAEEVGFEASCGKLKSEVLDAIPLPAIAHFHDRQRGHFVVIHRVGAERVVIADPAVGVRSLRRNDFLQRWTEQVVLLRPSVSFRKTKERHSPFLSLLRVALRERRYLLFSAGLALVGALLAYGMSVFVKFLLDQVIPRSNLHMLGLLGFGVIAVVCTRAIFNLARQYLLARVGLRLAVALGHEYVRHVVSLPIHFFDTRAGGDIFSRIFDAIHAGGTIGGPLLSVFLDIFLLTLCAALMVWYNIMLTLITLCFLPCVVLVAFVAMPSLRRKERQIREHLSQLANRFVETITNIRIIKAYTYEKEAYSRVGEEYAQMQRITFERAVLGNISGTLSMLLTGGSSIALLWVGARQTMEGHLTVGELMFFYSVLGLFVGSVDRLAPSIIAIQQAEVGVERLKEVNLISPEDKVSQPRLVARDFHGVIEFHSVSFWYRRAYPVLLNVNLQISAGETVAILGKTGSGKSTLAYLIAGLYDPKQGQILIDGLDTREIAKDSLRSVVAIAFQEPGLMSGSVLENIAVGVPGASPDHIREAAKRAMADEFISGLPLGYDYQLGSCGMGLSCGQRQRIAIARALLRNPKILVLDEATSNVDSETERAIMDCLGLNTQLRTTILITHRITTAARANRIIVLENGSVVEIGNHQELMSQAGRYYEMWSAFVPSSLAEPTAGRL
ncbi:MAG TPA: peptidase domain-containing ABC transporter [Candidatus Acidoferrales bacterium]|nr:peptidase domain-containing ABC transporter [Candidatus Acidoferrales bacterium]